MATSTGLKADEVLLIRTDYWRLTRNDELAFLYGQNRRRLPSFLKFYERIRQEGITEDEGIETLKYIEDLRSINDKIQQRCARLRRLNHRILEAEDKLRSLTLSRQRLENRVNTLREILKSVNYPS